MLTISDACSSVRARAKWSRFNAASGGKRRIDKLNCVSGASSLRWCLRALMRCYSRATQSLHLCAREATAIHQVQTSSSESGSVGNTSARGRRCICRCARVFDRYHACVRARVRASECVAKVQATIKLRADIIITSVRAAAPKRSIGSNESRDRN